MEKAAQFMFEIIFPREMIDNYGISDAEAGLLYKLWKEAKPGATRFSSTGDSDTLTGLKAKGYVVGHGNELEFTDKGKRVIREMVTNEPNSFSKNSTSVSYSNIKAKNTASKRERQAFTKKRHASNENETEPFNLRKESLRKMRE